MILNVIGGATLTLRRCLTPLPPTTPHNPTTHRYALHPYDLSLDPMTDSSSASGGSTVLIKSVPDAKSRLFNSSVAKVRFVTLPLPLMTSAAASGSATVATVGTAGAATIGSGASSAFASVPPSDYLVPYRDVPADIEYVERPPTPEPQPMVAATYGGVEGGGGAEGGEAEEKGGDDVADDGGGGDADADADAGAGADGDGNGDGNGEGVGSWVIRCEAPPMVFPPLPEQGRTSTTEVPPAWFLKAGATAPKPRPKSAALRCSTRAAPSLLPPSNFLSPNTL